MSKVGDSIGCSSNDTIDSTSTISILVPLQQIHKMQQGNIIDYKLLMLWLSPAMLDSSFEKYDKYEKCKIQAYKDDKNLPFP